MITQEYLKSILTYDPVSGKFYKNGREFGCINKKSLYFRVYINGKHYDAHRIAWLYYYGEMPRDDIDHINGIRSDNRIENLRDVSKSENHKNRKVRVDSNTGVIGVDKIGNRFRARITSNGKRIRLGIFNSLEDAKKSIESAKKKFGYHKNHGR